MTEGARRRRQILRYGNVVTAAAVSACLLGLLGAGFASVPGLGRALVPGHGVWTSASGGKLPVSQELMLPGLSQAVQVTFDRHGVASVYASTDADAFAALGYVHAKFRLAEMDTERRVAEGRLAQLTGSSAVGSDELELQLGLLRTAQQEWAQMPRTSPAARALVAYSHGVNDYLAQLRASKQWPAVFSLAGVYPRNWTPVDSLAVQGELTQELDFTTTPLDYALLERSLGARRTMDWFGVLPPDKQNPYDPGPYRKLPLVPAAGIQLAAASSARTAAGPVVTAASSARAAAGPVVTAASSARTAAGPVVTAASSARTAAGPVLTAASRPGSAGVPSAGLARAAAAILAKTRALPPGQLYTAPASNAWAANGNRVAGGGAMLAGDPHLPQTLPSIWYQVAITAPGLAVSGVSVPGLPGVLIGHNAHISWSLTDAQSQSALFYDEHTQPGRPGQYYWHGQWRKMTVLHETIPVRGGSSRQFTVEQTVHGPVLTHAGQTVSVDWMGALGSPDLADLLAIDQASSYRQFKTALSSWRSPALNFVYADSRGNIGAIAAGYYPQVRHGQPWLPLSGTGDDDIAGVIPFAAVPQVYDPPTHLIVSANQRPVTGSYPYYLGTTADQFDPGYRADTEVSYLRAHHSMTAADFASLQSDVSDHLAAEILPKLLDALHGARLTPVEQQAQQVLMAWSEQMSATSAGAAIWWTFWTNYLSAVFTPWWTSARVPVHLDSGGLKVSPGQFGLDEDLEGWTLHDQHNAVFSAPGPAPAPGAAPGAAAGAPPGTAVTAMRSAFVTTVRQLVGTLHESPQGWTWGALHTRQFPSLTGAAALGYGPRAASGDLWTVDAAEGGFLASDIGPSWRMIVAWNGSGKPVAEGIYPGGQSEDPASPWYSDLVAAWWAGTYLPMPAAGGRGVAVQAGSGTSGPTSVAAQASAGQLAGSAADTAPSAAGTGPSASGTGPSAAGTGPSASFASSRSLEAPPGLIVWELLP